MAGPNDFTGQNIQDTYQRVLQISSSGVITDGTGSIIQLNSSSIQTATTASHALFAVSASHETTFELSSSHAVNADSSISSSHTPNALTTMGTGTGNTEPRFSCNVAIQNQQEAYNVINQMCSVFRSMPFWSAGAFTITQDSPKDSSYLFTLANVLEPGFSYSNVSQKQRPTVVIAKYLDLELRDINYVEQIDSANQARYG